MTTDQTLKALRQAYRTGAPSDFRAALAKHEAAVRAEALREARNYLNLFARLTDSGDFRTGVEYAANHLDGSAARIEQEVK